MYSVVEIAGHQYKVQAGDILDVQKLEGKEGSKVNFDKVYFVGGDQALVGAPVVKGAKVSAKIIRHDKSRKILVFKRKNGQYKRKNGHRQHYTALLVTELNDGNGNTAKIEKDSKAAKKYL